MVGETEDVAKLMDERTDTHRLVGLTVDLLRGGVAVDLHVAQLDVCTDVGEVPAVRPDGVGLVGVGLAVASIDDIDVIDHAVTIGVIRREVHTLLVQEFAGLLDHLICVLRTLVTSIALIGARYLDWTVAVDVRVVVVA